MRLEPDFFNRDVLTVAPDLISKKIVRFYENGDRKEFVITETEAYRGEEDLACHASKGRTPRTEIMYADAGKVYVYLIYGMYWMLNFVCEKAGTPQAVLIRGVEGINGPGRVGKALQLDKTFYGEDIFTSSRIWIEDTNTKTKYTTSPRVGIDYAGDIWKNKPWRYIVKQ